MTRSVRSFYSTDETGAIIPLAEISVNFAGGAEAPIYTVKNGGTPVTQPLISTSSGKAVFYIEPGVYDIESKDPISLTTSTFSNEEIGVARGRLTKDTDVDFYFSTTEDLINNVFDTPPELGSIADSKGFDDKGDGGKGNWKCIENTGAGTASQSPAQLGDALLNDGNGNQWALVGKRINFQALGLLESNTGPQNDLVIAAAISTASAIVATIITNKIDQVVGSIYLPSGRFNYTEIDIPDGIIIEGDNAATCILVDTGTSTSRASIEVGSNTRESHRNGLYRVGLVGAGITDRNGINFNQSYRVAGIEDCAIDGFYDNVTGDTFAISLKHNRIYSAIRNNVSFINATAITFELNRIEIAGLHGVVIDGETGLEPINVSFNNDKIQSNGGSAIHGIDCLGVDIDNCFFESNNQLGGHNHLNFIGGTASRENGRFSMVGGFMSPGSGMTNSAAIQVGNIKTVRIDTFIRGGFNEGIRLGSAVDNAFIMGEIAGTGTQTVIPDTVNYIKMLRGTGIEFKGFTEQQTFKRIRSTGSNATSQNIDSTVLIDTTGGNRTYTMQTVDIEQGRQIKVQKTSGDANLLLVATQGAELVNGSATFSTTDAYALITITSDGTNVFVG